MLNEYFPNLSKREVEVLNLIVKGTSNSKQISEKLGISLRTVEVHRYNILRKTGCDNTIELVLKVFNQKMKMHRPSKSMAR